MKEIVFLLEEPSMKEMLKGLLPRVGEIPHINYIVFEGKSDLEKRLERKLRAYNNSDASFVILRDQDSGDCHIIKKNLVEKCSKTGKRCLIRIVCHELESWYLADLAAVEKGLGVKNLAKKQFNKKYRNPDRLIKPSQELVRLEHSYQKVNGSRAIGPYLDIENKRSKSFAVFIDGLINMLE